MAENDTFKSPDNFFKPMLESNLSPQQKTIEEIQKMQQMLENPPEVMDRDELDVFRNTVHKICSKTEPGAPFIPYDNQFSKDMHMLEVSLSYKYPDKANENIEMIMQGGGNNIDYSRIDAFNGWESIVLMDKGLRQKLANENLTDEQKENINTHLLKINKSVTNCLNSTEGYSQSRGGQSIEQQTLVFAIRNGDLQFPNKELFEESNKILQESALKLYEKGGRDRKWGSSWVLDKTMQTLGYDKDENGRLVLNDFGKKFAPIYDEIIKETAEKNKDSMERHSLLEENGVDEKTAQALKAMDISFYDYKNAPDKYKYSVEAFLSTTSEIAPQVANENTPVNPESDAPETPETPENDRHDELDLPDEVKIYLHNNNITLDEYKQNKEDIDAKIKKAQETDNGTKIDQQSKDDEHKTTENKEIPDWVKDEMQIYENASAAAQSNSSKTKPYRIEDINYENGDYARKFSLDSSDKQGFILNLSKEDPSHISIRGLGEDGIPSIEDFKVMARAEKEKAKRSGDTPNINLGNITDPEFKARLMIAMMEEGVKINNPPRWSELIAEKEGTKAVTPETKEIIEKIKKHNADQISGARIQELRGLAFGRNISKLDDRQRQIFKQNVQKNETQARPDDEATKLKEALFNSMLPPEKFEKLSDEQKKAASEMDERIKANIGEKASNEEVIAQKKLMIDFFGLSQENRQAFHDFGTEKEAGNEKLQQFKKTNEELDKNDARTAILKARGVVRDYRNTNEDNKKPMTAEQQKATAAIRNRQISSQWSGNSSR